MIAKDLMNRFVPLTEEEQKDLFFLMLDGMDFYAGLAKDCENSGQVDIFYKQYTIYEFFAMHFIKEKEEMQEIGIDHRKFLIEQAKKARKDFEESKNKA